MGSIILLAIGVALAAALLGSIAYQFAIPDDEISIFLEREKKCEKIALEGYKMHLKYPDSQPDELPITDRNELLRLDEMWINECVNRLSAETVFDIIQRVELDFRSGE